MLKLQWLNCIWLLVPILVWNAIFTSRLAHPAYEFDRAVPQWVLYLENVLRFVVFVMPFFMPLRWNTAQSKVGIAVYLIGVMVYFVAWIPLMAAPQSAWSNSLLGFLAPAYTPLLWLIGMGLVSSWWPYVILSVVFVGVHVVHWGQVYARVIG